MLCFCLYLSETERREEGNQLHIHPVKSLVYKYLWIEIPQSPFLNTTNTSSVRSTHCHRRMACRRSRLPSCGLTLDPEHKQHTLMPRASRLTVVFFPDTETTSWLLWPLFDSTVPAQLGSPPPSCTQSVPDVTAPAVQNCRQGVFYVGVCHRRSAESG